MLVYQRLSKPRAAAAPAKASNERVDLSIASLARMIMPRICRLLEKSSEENYSKHLDQRPLHKRTVAKESKWCTFE